MKKSIALIFLSIIFQTAGLAQNSFSVNFSFNSDTLTTEMQTLLDKKISLIYKSANKYQVALAGHTDSIGSKEFNQDLSRKRCIAVANYLKSKGLIINKLSYNDFSKPLSGNSTEKGRALNRRVEVLMTPLDQTVLEIPYEQYKFQAQKGANFIFKRSGTVLHIPQNAVTHKNGKSVQGEVVLKYREFRDAADFIISGITMKYDSAGTSYRFNSGGMFEIKAFQGNEELQLGTGKTVQMAFVLTDTLPDLNLYKLDEHGNHWEFKGDLDQRAIRNPGQNGHEHGHLKPDSLPKSNFHKFDCRTYVDLSCQTDTCEAIQTAIKMGLEYANSDKVVKPTLDVDNFSLDNRYASPSYSGVYLNKKHEITDRGYPIYFEKVREKGGKTTLLIKDKTGEHTEMKVLKDIAWVFNNKGNPRWKDSLFIKKWSDLRMTGHTPDGAIIFEFKDFKGHQIILHPVYLKEKITKKSIEKRSQFLYNDFNSHLDARRIAFADSLRNNNNVLERRLYQERNECFYNYSKLYSKRAERCMSIEDWFEYFNKNKAEMKNRYTELDEMYKDETKCQELVNQKIQEINVLIDSKETEEERKERLDEKYQLKLMFEMRLQMQKQGNIDGGQIFPEMYQELFLDGFGVWNCDQIHRLGSSITIEANYKDENGKFIKGRVLSMVDKNINGAISFDPNKISFNPKSRNTFVLFDTDDNKFILREEDLKKLNLTNSQEFTFTLQNITAKVKTSADLKRELGLE